MTYSTRTLSILSIVLVLGAAGGGIWWRLKPDTPSDDADAQSSALNDEVAAVTSASQQFSTDVPQPVGGSPVVLDTLWITVTAAGEAAAFREATLTAQVEGMVAQLPVRENLESPRGRRLLQIDTTEYALNVAKARAALETAQAEYQKIVLLDEEIVDASIREERERIARSRSGLTGAEVDLRQAGIALDRATVRAPFGGRVADLQVVAGQWVGVGTELLTLVDLDPIKVEVQVLEAELGFLEEGRGVEVTFAAFPGEVFEGRIETINPRVDTETRTGRVTVHLSNEDGRIKPGMYAQVKIDAQAFPDRVLLPHEALLERDGRSMVFVYKPNENGRGGRADWRYVTTGRENEDWYELTRGDEGWVDPGEIVLTSSHHYLAHDVAVRLVENSTAEGGRPNR
jgi:RND family efflux transporter MFP subunit